MNTSTLSYQVEPNWNDNSREEGFVGDSMHQDWELTDLDKLCFNCNLPECKEDSKKCPIKRAKKEGLKVIQAELIS